MRHAIEKANGMYLPIVPRLTWSQPLACLQEKPSAASERGGTLRGRTAVWDYTQTQHAIWTMQMRTGCIGRTLHTVPSVIRTREIYGDL